MDGSTVSNQFSLVVSATTKIDKLTLMTRVLPASLIVPSNAIRAVSGLFASSVAEAAVQSYGVPRLASAVNPDFRNFAAEI